MIIVGLLILLFSVFIHCFIHCIHFEVPAQLQESSLADPSPINAVAAVPDITYHFTTSQRGADQLVHSVGYSYNTKWEKPKG